MSKLYSALEIQAAYTAWATLSVHLFPSHEAWISARRELWFVYTDARDNKPRGISKAHYDATPEQPQMQLI